MTANERCSGATTKVTFEQYAFTIGLVKCENPANKAFATSSRLCHHPDQRNATIAKKITLAANSHLVSDYGVTKQLAHVCRRRLNRVLTGIGRPFLEITGQATKRFRAYSNLPFQEQV